MQNDYVYIITYCFHTHHFFHAIEKKYVVMSLQGHRNTDIEDAQSISLLFLWLQLLPTLTVSGLIEYMFLTTMVNNAGAGEKMNKPETS